MFSTIQHKKTLGNLILMSFSIAVSLIALEVAIRILDNVNLIKLPAGGSLGRSVGLYEHDDLLGWKNRPGFNKEKRYKYGDEYRTVVETINSKGLRDREYTLKKPDNTYRIVSLGCSRTYGYGVNNDETYTTVLEQLLNQESKANIEVLNLGVNGFGIDQMVLNFEKNGKDYSPDLVILQVYLPNIIRSQYERNFSTAKPVFRVEKGELVLANTPVPKDYFKPLEEILMSRSYLYAYIKGSLLRIDQASRAETDSSVASNEALHFLSAKILNRLKDSVESTGARLIVFFWTPEDKLYTHIGKQARVEMINLFDYVNEDELANLRPLDNPPPVRHWSVNGNRFVAMALLNYMKQNNIGVDSG